jgi:hypothetical protein
MQLSYYLCLPAASVAAVKQWTAGVGDTPLLGHLAEMLTKAKEEEGGFKFRGDPFNKVSVGRLLCTLLTEPPCISSQTPWSSLRAPSRGTLLSQSNPPFKETV